MRLKSTFRNSMILLGVPPELDKMCWMTDRTKAEVRLCLLAFKSCDPQYFPGVEFRPFQYGSTKGYLYSATAGWVRPEPAVAWLRFMIRASSPEKAISTASTKNVSLKAIMVASCTSFL